MILKETKYQTLIIKAKYSGLLRRVFKDITLIKYYYLILN